MSKDKEEQKFRYKKKGKYYNERTLSNIYHPNLHILGNVLGFSLTFYAFYSKVTIYGKPSYSDRM